MNIFIHCALKSKTEGWITTEELYSYAEGS